MIPLPWSLILKGVAVAALVGGAYLLWHGEREAYKDAAVKEVTDAVKAEADRDGAAKLETALARGKAMAAAFDEAQIDLSQLKGQLDEKDRVITAGAVERDRLRATRVVARRSEVRSDSGSACHAQELRSERLAVTVVDLQASNIEVAESNIELRSYLLECDAGAATDAVMLRWWPRVERAMRLGENPPPQP